MSQVPIYTPGWRQSGVKETMRRARLEPQTSRSRVQGVKLTAQPHMPPPTLAYKSSSNFFMSAKLERYIFMFSAAKPSKRTRARLVSPAENHIK